MFLCHVCEQYPGLLRFLWTLLPCRSFSHCCFESLFLFHFVGLWIHAEMIAVVLAARITHHILNFLIYKNKKRLDLTDHKLYSNTYLSYHPIHFKDDREESSEPLESCPSLHELTFHRSYQLYQRVCTMSYQLVLSYTENSTQR